jgi:hypothetical protein
MGAIAAVAAGLVGLGVHHQLETSGVRADRAVVLAGVVSLVIFALVALFVLAGPSPLWFGLLAGAAAGLSVARAELG